MIEFIYEMLGNITEKNENDDYHPFHLFRPCFLEPSSLECLKLMVGGQRLSTDTLIIQHLEQIISDCL